MKGQRDFERRDSFSGLFGYGPRATPLVHDNLLYTVDATGMMHWFDVSGGKLDDRAGRSLLKNHNAPNLTFGVSASPLAVDDTVVGNTN